MIKKKICMVGAFAVGKTSLVSRFVKNTFTEKYQTSVGMSVHEREVSIRGQQIKLMIWDLVGEDEINKMHTSHFRGAQGILLVVDGTRKSTIDTARDLRDRFLEAATIPYIVALNKSDMAETWEADQSSIDSIADKGLTIFKTSAKTGEHVEEAFLLLAEQMVFGKQP